MLKYSPRHFALKHCAPPSRQEAKFHSAIGPILYLIKCKPLLLFLYGAATNV
jgi:hypothetical protein